MAERIPKMCQPGTVQPVVYRAASDAQSLSPDPYEIDQDGPGSGSCLGKALNQLSRRLRFEYEMSFNAPLPPSN
jgi:hypothetical protein